MLISTLQGEAAVTRSKILIVEDQQSIRETYAELLEQEGFVVCQAEGYDDAVLQVDGSIDLALLDIQLVGRSGLEILVYIRERYPDCPVIMMSGYADKENTLKALRQGAVEYLEKPVDPDELVYSVGHWLDFRAMKQENLRLQDFQAIHQRLQENEAQIRQANERLNFLLTSTAAVIYAATVDDDYGTTFISENIRRMCGYEADRFMADPGFRMACVHPDDVARVREACKRALVRSGGRFEYRFRHRDGHYLWVGDEVRVEADIHGQPELMGFMVDISERKQGEEKIRQMAYTDLLTGLPNRSLYYDRLQQAIAQCRRSRTMMAVLFMDLDYFKPVNDELGHEWGDEALIEVGRRLQHCIRETDTVARIGGDEFSIILGEIGSEQAAAHVADKIIAAIQEPMILKESRYVLGISIGICIQQGEYSDVESFMRLADDAMYRAKEGGRNRYCICHYPDAVQTTLLHEDITLEKALRQALLNDQLLLYYQPKVDLKSGVMIGTHALLRWDRGDGELLLPAQFLPQAGKAGLIVPIGQWVLRTACRQSRAWQQAGLPIVPVSVNVTAEQLRQADFYAQVKAVLAESGLSADMLELEISEKDLMQQEAGGLHALQELSVLGVKITMDHFGSGLFSLQSLKALPLHELKIDRQLVSQIGEGGEQIARAIIAMGHILNHQVVAEGVETDDQLCFLRDHDSDGMLGYLSSPPLPGEAIAEYLQHNMPMLNAGKDG
ncbi:EAL domain-containing protein [Mariprofundus erugo]|nr:EAL domain-containing protein [Mariprofundus erugo]